MSIKLSNDAKPTHSHAPRHEVAVKRGSRLRFLRKITGMVTDPFSKLCGVGRTTISSWEQGINSLTEKGAGKIVNSIRKEGIHCTVLWLLHGIGEPPKIEDQEKLSNLKYHTLDPTLQPAAEEEKIEYANGTVEKEIKLFKTCYTEHLIYHLKDYTMYPTYRPGDWLGGIVLSYDALELAHDMDCIVQFKNGGKVARRIRIENVGTTLSLYGINAESSIEHPPIRYLMLSEVSSVAPIIRVWRNNLQTV